MSTQDLTITAHVRLDGFDFELCFSGQLDQLPALTKRIRELGGEPTVPAASTPAKPKAQRVSPFYDGSGDACCPTHRKPLSEGRYGLYCSAKAKEGEPQNDKGYCALRFIEE